MMLYNVLWINTCIYVKVVCTCVTMAPAHSPLFFSVSGVTIGFSREEYDVMEGSSVEVCVGVINGTIADNQSVVVNVTTEDGTAMGE